MDHSPFVAASWTLSLALPGLLPPIVWDLAHSLDSNLLTTHNLQDLVKMVRKGGNWGVFLFFL